ncbi:glycosyltransferase family 2 protein [Paenibacillus apiarius]|uniref:glycosyltransferase family 2 protein n=1 Tax=Paenibacillus apiarius TaxID=46240 RepID=UPI001F0905DD|nr:glycosyltransferase [Paenibacillus apiarius]
MRQAKRLRPRLTRGRKRRARMRFIGTHPHPVVSVIIPVMNERRTISRVIQEAARVHPQTEVIVVCNGTTDGSDRIAEAFGVRLLRFPAPLGHDVGRTVGAQAAGGDILLFIDGDMIIRASQLQPFIEAVANGIDVALNNYSGPTNKREVHRVVLAKHALNALLSRPDLKGTSLTAVPHAISRRALDTIGSEALSVPPLAHAMSIQRGLNVKAVHAVDVGKLNPIRIQGSDPLEHMIQYDHMLAVRWIIEQTGARGGHSDLTRQRERVK